MYYSYCKKVYGALSQELQTQQSIWNMVGDGMVTVTAEADDKNE